MFREKMKDLFRVSAIAAVGVIAAAASPDEAKAGLEPTWTEFCAGNSSFKMSYWEASDSYIYYRNANAHIPGAPALWIQTPTYGCPWNDRPPIEAASAQRPLAEIAAGYDGGQIGGYTKPDFEFSAGSYGAGRIETRPIATPCIGCDTTPGVVLNPTELAPSGRVFRRGVVRAKR